jgi:hypothetical protein
MKNLFSIEDEQDTLEHFLANIIGCTLIGIFTIKLGTFIKSLIHLFGCLLKNLVLALGLKKKLFAVLIDSIFRHFGVLALECLLECDGVSFQFS